MPQMEFSTKNSQFITDCKTYLLLLSFFYKHKTEAENHRPIFSLGLYFGDIKNNNFSFA